MLNPLPMRGPAANGFVAGLFFAVCLSSVVSAADWQFTAPNWMAANESPNESPLNVENSLSIVGESPAEPIFRTPSLMEHSARTPVMPAEPMANNYHFTDESQEVSNPLDRTWTLQPLPEGLMYTSYLAGVREPRFAAQWLNDPNEGWIWDIALGGRVGLVRYGTSDPLHPEGWQLDMEGAAFPRIDLDDNSDLIACDYRFGMPVTHAIGRNHYKLGYYHISSHLGDEWLLRYNDARRINYVRDAMVAGYSFYWTPDLRLYAEVAYAFNAGEFTEPWEFQFGVDYSPAQPTGPRPVPFMAVNAHLREEVDFGGNFVVEIGWQWRGATGHLLRMGMEYFTGMSEQFEFFDRYENKLGFGIWYDY